MKRALLALPFLLALTGCMSTGFHVRTKFPADPGKVVVVVPAGFADRAFALGPVVEAGAYRTGYELFKDKYAQVEAAQASKATTKTIENLTAAGYSVVKADDPLTVSLAHDLNPWAFDPTLDQLDWNRFGPLVRSEAAKAKASYVVVEAWRAIVDSVGLLGLGGDFHVVGTVAIFSAEGRLVGLGTFNSDVGSGGSGDTSAYQVKLTIGEGAKELLVKALTGSK